MKIQDIILWILFIIAVIVGLWYLFGNSPTFEQAIIIFVLTILFGIMSKTIKTETKLESLVNKFDKLEKSFIKLSNDFKTSKN